MANTYCTATNFGKGFFTHEDRNDFYLSGHAGDVWVVGNNAAGVSWINRINGTAKVKAEAQAIVDGKVEGNLKASNVIIVGNTIVNASDPDKGKAELDNVTVVSNEETGDMTLEVKKYLEPGETYARNDGNKVLPSFFLGADGTFGAMADANGEGYILADDTDEKFMHIAENQLMQTMMGPAFERGAIPDFNRFIGPARSRHNP